MIPFFRYRKTWSNIIKYLNVLKLETNSFVSWASFDVCMDIPFEAKDNDDEDDDDDEGALNHPKNNEKQVVNFKAF